MDALMLARIQFGFAVGFHYLFPVTTLGLTFFILIFETLYLKKKDETYRIISDFLVKMLGLIFALGVATGLLMPLVIGGNWAHFAVFSGPIFGAALAIEAITAFALESAFLAILIFGRKKVSAGVYWISAFLVFFGSHLSGFWIVAANSWMQSPAGYIMQDGRVVLTHFWQAILNPTTAMRFVHVVIAAWLTGAFLVAAAGAYYLAQGRFPKAAGIMLRLALPIALIASLLQLASGHFHIMDVLKYNPEKDAAYEGIFKTTRGATLYAFGIPDAKNRTIHFGVGLPYGLSLLESGNPFSEVKGLEEYPEEEWPPVNIIFTTFHLMVMLGMIFIAVSALGVFLLWRKRLFETAWYLKYLPLIIPLPYLANELGWAGAEIGRQPWLIYKLLRTAEGVSTSVPAWQVVATLGGLLVLYAAIFAFTLFFIRRIMLQGLETERS